MAMDPQLSIKFEGSYKRVSCLAPYEDKLTSAELVIAAQADDLAATRRAAEGDAAPFGDLAGPSPVTITSMTEFLTMKARNVVPKYAPPQRWAAPQTSSHEVGWRATEARLSEAVLNFTRVLSGKS
jgi:hypothetical protein